MTDSKQCLKHSKGTTNFVLLVGALWMANALSSGSAGGQPPKDDAPQIPAPPAAILAQPAFVSPPAPAFGAPGQARFHFVIPPDTLLRDLLPIPPRVSAGGPRLIDDISQVPEVAFQEPLAKTPEALKLTAETMAKINHVNRVKTDTFMEVLLRERPDLAGLPVAMGDACRTKGDRTKFFTQALNTIKQARGQQGDQVQVTTFLAPPVPAPQPPAGTGIVPGAVPTPPGAGPVVASPAPGAATESLVEVRTGARLASPTNTDPDAFWDQFVKLCAQEDKANSKLDPPS